MIPDEEVERVRDAADIVQIIGEHVNLKRVGSDWRGPCPFHQGTHRNFSVSTKKRMYYCFVCHEGGDVFNFLQKRLGLDWPSAVRAVADKSGLELREVDSRREGPDPREPVWELNATVGEYFQNLLWNDDVGRPAREYLAERHLSREQVERFGLGYAPREIGLMRSYLNTLGFDDDRLLAAGLLVRREEGDEPRPRFRGRLMFPIYDASGRLSGFGGRLLGPGEPKYLNSADSATFTKGRLLYGLSWAKQAIRRDDRVLLVEGYFDVVRLVLAGIETAVAPLGTALTPDQAALVARYTKNAFLLYDSDKAGLRATFRAGDLLLAQGAAVRVVTLPEGEDPDTFVDKHGGPRLEAHIDAAVDVFDRKVQLLERAGWFADLHRRRQAIDRLLPTIRAAVDPLTRDIYIARASEASGVDRGVLQREVETAARGRGGGGAPAARAEAAQPRDAQPSMRFGDRRLGERRGPIGARTGERGAAAERELLRAVIIAGARVDALAERVGPETFHVPVYREIFTALLRHGDDTPVPALAEGLSPEAIGVLEELMGEPNAIVDVVKTVEGSLAHLRVRALEERNEMIDREITVAKTDAERDMLLREKHVNLAEVRALGGRGWRKFGKSTS